MSKNQKNEQAYRKIVFKNTRMEDKALEVLYEQGPSFRYIGMHQYEITSGQCLLLREKGIDYKFKR